MKIQLLDNQIQDAQLRLQAIQEQSKTLPSSPDLLLKETISELSIALEELHVAVEELHLQNDELIGTRQAVEQERQRYQALFEFAPDAYLVTDVNGTIQEANSAAETLLNLERKYLCNKPLIVFIAQSDRKNFSSYLSQLKTADQDHKNQNSLTKPYQIKEWEVEIQPRDRQVLPGEISLSSIYNSQGRLVGWRWLIRDLTQRKQAEETAKQLQEERELNQLKNRILRTISHEFRTPMNIIYLSTQLLERSVYHYSDREFRLFHKIRKSIERMIHLLEDILVFNKAEVGKLSAKPQEIELVSFCESLVEELQMISEDKKIHFINHCQNLPACLDPKLLRQIIDNLVTNALKYSSSGSVIIFELYKEEQQAVFCIQDQGMGIPLEDQASILEPFYRSKNVNEIAGTGLGLAIVQKAVELHGGAIAFTSEVGVGTTFTITLPLRKINDSVPTSLRSWDAGSLRLNSPDLE